MPNKVWRHVRIRHKHRLFCRVHKATERVKSTRKRLKDKKWHVIRQSNESNDFLGPVMFILSSVWWFVVLRQGCIIMLIHDIKRSCIVSYWLTWWYYKVQTLCKYCTIIARISSVISDSAHSGIRCKMSSNRVRLLTSLQHCSVVFMFHSSTEQEILEYCDSALPYLTRNASMFLALCNSLAQFSHTRFVVTSSALESVQLSEA